MTRSPTPFAIEVGAIISPRPCGRPLSDQSRIHQCNGIDAAEDYADPFLAFVEGIAAVGEALLTHHPGFSAVITRQAAKISRQHPAHALTLTHGRVTDLDEGAGGVTFTTQILVTDETSEPFAEMTTTMLLIDPARPPQERSARAPNTTPPPAEASDAMEIIGRHTFSPDAARAFEQGRPPSLHSDPEQAQVAGFAKPIVSGNQVFSIIWKRFIEPTHTLPVSMSFTLKRPIFWDEEITFARTRPRSAEHETIEVRNSAGKAAIVCVVSPSEVS